MIRRKLKNNGKCRPKAGFGVDGAIAAAATITAAVMNGVSMAKAAKTQAKAIDTQASIQSKALAQQNTNNNNLQKESIAFTRQQNAENRQQQQDIQTTLQMMAGKENTNQIMERQKAQVKYGGMKSNRRSIKSKTGNRPFQITDGGGAIPLKIDNNGYGLYELYGNDHEHYHKAPGGKNKTGVGVKLQSGNIIEGEGNQNTNQGELMYVTPNDTKFISKHSIDGFNPTKAVLAGVHPEEAFAIQEAIKARNGISNDGKSKRRSMKAMVGGLDPALDIANLTQNPSNGTAATSAGVVYAVNNQDLNNDNNVAKYGGRDKAKCGGRRRLKCGGRRKAQGGYWDNYGGATLNSAGNLTGSFIDWGVNSYVSRKLGNAYKRAGDLVADAYRNMHGISMDEIKREDFAAPHTLAVIREANTNINPQLERLRRNAEAERREINRGTISSAARQQRLAGVNDRLLQRVSEQYATKNNEDERIKQGNAERITQTAQANADRDLQARKDWATQRLSLLQYNNDIENTKIAGIAQAQADALTQAATVKAQGAQATARSFGNAIRNSGQAFQTAHDNAVKTAKEDAYSFARLSSTEQKNYVMQGNAPEQAKVYYQQQRSNFNNATSDKDKDIAFANIQALINKYPNLGFELPIYKNLPYSQSPITITGHLVDRNSLKLPNKLF